MRRIDHEVFMSIKRIIFAFSIAATTISTAFADLVDLNAVNNQSMDRIEQLTKSLNSSSTKMSVTLRDKNKAIEIDNESLEKKYGLNVSSNFNASNNPYSWLVTHPLPSARVSSNYGGRTMGGRAENHSGLDLAAPAGTPIYATGPGIVTKSGWGTGYGQYVEINHGNGYLTRYAHASRLIVNVGDQVEAGDHIANVGCTGRCTGPHLHYEVVKDGQRKNPSSYLAMLD